jgi:hypothetical protein
MVSMMACVVLLVLDSTQKVNDGVSDVKKFAVLSIVMGIIAPIFFTLKAVALKKYGS